MNVLGLQSDTTKKEVTSKFDSFCNLCRKKIYKGETIFSWPGNQFFVHLNCNDPKVKARTDNTYFRKNLKKKPKKKLADKRGYDQISYWKAKKAGKFN